MTRAGFCSVKSPSVDLKVHEEALEIQQATRKNAFRPASIDSILPWKEIQFEWQSKAQIKGKDESRWIIWTLSQYFCTKYMQHENKDPLTKWHWYDFSKFYYWSRIFWRLQWGVFKMCSSQACMKPHCSFACGTVPREPCWEASSILPIISKDPIQSDCKSLAISPSLQVSMVWNERAIQGQVTSLLGQVPCSPWHLNATFWIQ